VECVALNGICVSFYAAGFAKPSLSERTG